VPAGVHCACVHRLQQSMPKHRISCFCTTPLPALQKDYCCWRINSSTKECTETEAHPTRQQSQEQNKTTRNETQITKITGEQGKAQETTTKATETETTAKTREPNNN